jgi:hypothetical protein
MWVKQNGYKMGKKNKINRWDEINKIDKIK